jgi:Abnormal spindle-like microcephaly-assoc'd, ASPM-SPD-2-Hydin
MMKEGVWITVAVVQSTVSWLAVAQTETASPAQTNLLAGSGQQSPVIAVSPGVLDFGLVGVSRTKDLTITVRNVGGGLLQGKATVEAPFSVAGNSYSLRSGQSQSLTVQYTPTAQGTNRQSLVFSGGSTATVPVIGSARFPPPPPGKPHLTSKPSQRFVEEEVADFIVRYYSDSTSYVLKPPMMSGIYRSIYDRPLALKLAAQQPGRELAVVVLVHYPTAEGEETIKLAWINDLKRLGYQRVVFLRGGNKMTVKKLPVLDDPQDPAKSAGN